MHFLYVWPQSCFNRWKRTLASVGQVWLWISFLVVCIWKMDDSSHSVSSWFSWDIQSLRFSPIFWEFSFCWIWPPWKSLCIHVGIILLAGVVSQLLLVLVLVILFSKLLLVTSLRQFPGDICQHRLILESSWLKLFWPCCIKEDLGQEAVKSEQELWKLPCGGLRTRWEGRSGWGRWRRQCRTPPPTSAWPSNLDGCGHCKYFQLRPHDVVDEEDVGGAEEGAVLIEEHQHHHIQNWVQVEPFVKIVIEPFMKGEWWSFLTWEISSRFGCSLCSSLEIYQWQTSFVQDKVMPHIWSCLKEHSLSFSSNKKSSQISSS